MAAALRPDVPLLLAILDELPIGVWVAHAPGGELAYANGLFAEILGVVARDDVRAGEYVAAYNLCDRAGNPYSEERLPFARALREQRTVVVDDIVIVAPDGTRRFVRAVAKPLRGGKGEISHVMVVFSDISAEVAAETERSAVQERLRMAVYHAPIVLFTTDATGNITLSEGAALAGLGFTSGQLVGQNSFDIYRNQPEIIAAMRRVLGGETFTIVTEHGDFALESWLSPLRDERGEMQGMIGVCTDITERLRLQRQIAHADRIASLGRLAASVAHEINNPLTYAIEAIRLATEIAARAEDAAGGDLARLRELLDDAAEGAERVRLITRDLSAFARPDEDARRPVELDAAIASAIKLVAKRTAMRAEVVVELEARAHVLADEARLVQIFVNLLLNAADALAGAAAGAARHHRIRVSSRRSGDAAVVEVADSGPGVPAELRERIFDAFVTSKPAFEGTGLGLYVTRGLVSALSGTIEVGTAPEGGALFKVTLPVTCEARAERAVPSQRPPVAVRPRVLIIDDEPQVARVLCMALEDECDVASVHGVDAALRELLGGARYDVVFCDVMMAGLNGLELYERLRELGTGQERDIVFMTGGIFDPQMAERFARVPNRVVDKPFDVRAEVWKHVSSRAAAR